MREVDCILVSLDRSHGEDSAVLIVGRKDKKQAVDIINAFQGQEAIELYKKLTETKGE